MEKFSLERALSLESKYDDSLATRPISDWLSKFVFSFSIIFALYHYITSGTIHLENLKGLRVPH